MKKMKIPFLLTAALFLPSCVAQDNLRWISDYQEARKVSRATGKPILVQFRCEA